MKKTIMAGLISLVVSFMFLGSNAALACQQGGTCVKGSSCDQCCCGTKCQEKEKYTGVCYEWTCKKDCDKEEKTAE